MTRHLVVVDTETTGLDPAVHVPVEIAWHDVDTDDRGWFLPPVTAEQLAAADPIAMEINRYWQRIGRHPATDGGAGVRSLHDALHGHTLAGSKPAFDAAMLAPLFASYGLSPEPQHHHPVDLPSFACGRLGLDPGALAGLHAVCDHLGIPPGDHTAAGDVAATVDCFRTLMAMTA